MDIEYTELIASIFDYNSLSYIITCLVQIEGKSLKYQRQCFALSILLKSCPDLKKFAINLFDSNVAPFEKFDNGQPPPSKKHKNNGGTLTDLEVVKCCYNLLEADSFCFKSFWNWSIFIKNYLHKGEGLQKLYTHHILRILNNMSPYQFESLNSDISDDILITFREESYSNQNLKKCVVKIIVIERIVRLNIFNKMIANIENVLLPIFNYENSVNYERSSEIVYTKSTKVNLRSIAMGITSGKAVCLNGPVGSGKTTLIEFIARKTGRICGKSKTIQVMSKKRKLNEVVENDTMSLNGFLRIQLGDQTDSKMLLGQYKCTDVPGEFIWLPGVLTKVINQIIFILHILI